MHSSVQFSREQGGGGTDAFRSLIDLSQLPTADFRNAIQIYFIVLDVALHFGLRVEHIFPVFSRQIAEFCFYK